MCGDGDGVSNPNSGDVYPSQMVGPVSVIVNDVDEESSTGEPIAAEVMFR